MSLTIKVNLGLRIQSEITVFDSEPVIDVKDKYITYPIDINFNGKTWNTD